MKSTKDQLRNANIDCAKKFGAKIIDLFLKFDNNSTTSIFESTFKDFETSKIYQQLSRMLACKHIEHNTSNLVILPPILLRSESNFILQRDNMILIFESHGPIIPVVSTLFLETHQNFIRNMYRLHSEDFICNYEQFVTIFNNKITE
jgi:hypothetical protein